MTEEKFMVADKIEDMRLPPYKKVKCGNCTTELGISKSSQSILDEHKDMRFICHNCFMDKDDPDIELQRPTKEQIDDLRKIIPDFGEAEIRRGLENIKRMKNERRTRVI